MLCIVKDETSAFQTCWLVNFSDVPESSAASPKNEFPFYLSDGFMQLTVQDPKSSQYHKIYISTLMLSSTANDL